MDFEDLLAELDIESAEDFKYFEQFSALMETEFENLEYDDFAEIMMMADSEALSEMTNSFFEDLIHGVPDDNTELYSVIQSIKDTLITLAEHTHHRGRGFYSDELFRFREWLLAPESVKCTTEADGTAVMLSPLHALMLFREEKLSGTKYNYDFSDMMPEGPDEYTLNIISEFSDDDYAYNSSIDYDPDDDGLDELPIELPRDFDISSYDPDDTSWLTDVDPYTDGFVDRYNPVIDNDFNYDE